MTVVTLARTMTRPPMNCFLLLPLFFVLSVQAIAQTDAVVLGSASEVRQHWVVTSSNGIDDFALTRIQRLSESDDKTEVLIQTPSGGRLVATHEWNYESQISWSEIRDDRTGEFLRISLTYPYTTRTRTATLDAARKNPKLVSSDIPFEISARGNGRLSGIESHWRDPATAREWRTRVRQMVAPAFLEDLEVVDSSGLFSSAMLSSLHEFLLQFVLYRTSCDTAAGLEVTPSVPDCSFDQEFSRRCSDAQVKRARAAADAKLPNRY